MRPRGVVLFKIAILPTSTMLRMQVTKRGAKREVLNGKVIGDLAAHYDVIIIASTASDQFYEYLYNSMPLQQRSRFRLYGRTFFANQSTEEGGADELDGPTGISDPRSRGWMEILRENNILFEPLRKTMGEDLLPRMESFNWEHIEDFIIDDRVHIIRSEADIG